MEIIQPQHGPQSLFVTHMADIAIYGGAAGGGKSFGLLLQELYKREQSRYSSVTFRRTYPQIAAPGGLWESSERVFSPVGAHPNESKRLWTFPSGAQAFFRHLQHDSDRTMWDGASIAGLKFDELDQFTEQTFFYLLARNRSTSGVRPFVRATCNANADSWVANFIQWWWDKETGFPIPERSGQVRWMVRQDREIKWATDPNDLEWPIVEVGGEKQRQPPKSVTFIPARVTDNEALLRSNPEYLPTLLAMAPVDRARFLDGNWKIRDVAGIYFRRNWFGVVAQAPPTAKRVRRWDFAATEDPRHDGTKSTRKSDPDWTVGVLMAMTDDKRFIVEDVVRLRATPGQVMQTVKQTAKMDGRRVRISLEQEPGASGKSMAADYIRELAGYEVYARPATGRKTDRAKPLSAQAEARNVFVVAAEWNEVFFDEMELFPDGPHDDIVDSASGAFIELTGGKYIVQQKRMAVSPPRVIPFGEAAAKLRHGVA